MESIDLVGDINTIARTAKDVLPQTTNETDGALATLVGWFNHVVLFPVKQANLTYRYKLECFEEELRAKVMKIEPENLCEPKLMIAGPTLEALKYAYDEEELREMYVNLLSSSMDKSKAEIAHPSFVEIIKRMNSVDAHTFKYLAPSRNYIKATNPDIEIKETNMLLADVMPEWFVGWTAPGADLFQTSASLVRLDKLGIIELMFDRTAGADGYLELEQAVELLDIRDQVQRSNPEKELALISRKSILYINEHGKQFARCCL